MPETCLQLLQSMRDVPTFTVITWVSNTLDTWTHSVPDLKIYHFITV